MKRFCVLGKNIGYAKSPAIHKSLLDYLGIKASFDICDIQEDRLKDVGSILADCLGFSVTKPYKQSIIPYLTKNNAPFEAVNCVHNDGGMIGYNTDEFGFGASLDLLCDKLEGKEALILGNGGASGAVFYALTQRGCRVSVLGRNRERVKAFLLANGGTREQIYSMDKKPYLVVNATTLGLNKGENPCDSLKFDSSCMQYAVDVNYFDTDFLRGFENIAQTKNGVDMLVLQAIKAQSIWNKLDLTNKQINDIFVDTIREIEGVL